MQDVGMLATFYVGGNGPTVNAKDLRQKPDGQPNERRIKKEKDSPFAGGNLPFISRSLSGLG